MNTDSIYFIKTESQSIQIRFTSVVCCNELSHHLYEKSRPAGHKLSRSCMEPYVMTGFSGLYYCETIKTGVQVCLMDLQSSASESETILS